jgi:hypothetical protein
MSQWEEVELKDATHVEINGEVHEIKERDGIVERSVDFGSIDILVEQSVDCYIDVNKWANIPKEAFPFLGIKCLRKFKPTPIEFEAAFAKYDGRWHPLYSLDDGLSYQNCKKATFKCVEILEEN